MYNNYIFFEQDIKGLIERFPAYMKEDHPVTKIITTWLSNPEEDSFILFEYLSNFYINNLKDENNNEYCQILTNCIYCIPKELGFELFFNLFTNKIILDSSGLYIKISLLDMVKLYTIELIKMNKSDIIIDILEFYFIKSKIGDIPIISSYAQQILDNIIYIKNY